jgi:hypothetical protein
MLTRSGRRGSGAGNPVARRNGGFPPVVAANLTTCCAGSENFPQIVVAAIGGLLQYVALGADYAHNI